MLSILIPIYQQDATTLVADLKAQCEKLGITYVILVYDDKSTIKWRRKNAPLQHEFGVNYIELSKNLGRAKIRNWLASAAPYDNLLFLDGDSKIVRKTFIKTYMDFAEQPYDAVFGGRRYKKTPPRSLRKRLHWKYGKTYESVPHTIRQKDPVLNFQSNNFMIKASALDKVKFDETIQTYGYEDLLFAEKLAGEGFSISHIDNPTEHLGLEYTEDFLAKNEEAIKNLIKLQASGQLKETRLSKYYKRLEKWHMQKLIPFVYRRLEKTLHDRLHRKDPDVRAFQLQKLYWYHSYRQVNSSHAD